MGLDNWAGATPGNAYIDSNGDIQLNGANLWLDDGVVEPGTSSIKRRVVTTAVDLTLTAAHSGAVIVVTGADKVITLPATVEGLEFTIVVGVVSVATGLSVSPVAADSLIGNGFTVADNKDAINTQETERVGDSITLLGNGSTGYYIVNAHGTWAREA